MRLWSIHPKYLDRLGLVALWREALLAQKVLLGKTRGYRTHPQLSRFRIYSKTIKTIEVIGFYLYHIYKEGVERGYKFNLKKITRVSKNPARIKVAQGQIAFEYKHLKRKLSKRDPVAYRKILRVANIQAHPLFKIVKGPREAWEKSGERKNA